MKFFNIDFHISVIADIKHIFAKLGHHVIDWSLSGHTWVLKREQAKLPFNMWDLSEKNITAFYEHYKKELDQYDGFICCYPISLLKFYLKWNKPIIAVICVRYEIPWTQSRKDWIEFDNLVCNLIQQKRLFLIANNKGDQSYFEYYNKHTKIPWIPSLCEYVNIDHTSKLNQVENRMALFSRNVGLPVSNVSILPFAFSWEDLHKCKAVIHLPYHNTTMSLCEHYTSNMPIFAPSRALLKKWVHDPSKNLLNEINFFRVSRVAEPDDDSPNNMRRPEVLEWWMDRMDVYDPENMPHVLLFHDLQELENKQTNIELLKQTSLAMKSYNQSTKRPFVYRAWRNILSQIQNNNITRHVEYSSNRRLLAFLIRDQSDFTNWKCQAENIAILFPGWLTQLFFDDCKHPAGNLDLFTPSVEIIDVPKGENGYDHILKTSALAKTTQSFCYRNIKTWKCSWQERCFLHDWLESSDKLFHSLDSTPKVGMTTINVAHMHTDNWGVRNRALITRDQLIESNQIYYMCVQNRIVLYEPFLEP